jgi:hypothetical protein
MKTGYLDVFSIRALRRDGAVWVWINRALYRLSEIKSFSNWERHDIHDAVNESPEGAEIVVINHNFSVRR